MTRLAAGEKGISLIGARALNKYGAVEFAEKTSPLFSAPLSRRMSNEEIQKELNPSTVELGEIYKLLETLPQKTRALFYVPDKDGSTRPVFVFHEDGGWNVVSPNDEEVPTWGETDVLFSKTPI